VRGKIKNILNQKIIISALYERFDESGLGYLPGFFIQNKIVKWSNC
jgi:hypothetical protein